MWFGLVFKDLWLIKVPWMIWDFKLHMLWKLKKKLWKDYLEMLKCLCLGKSSCFNLSTIFSCLNQPHISSFLYFRSAVLLCSALRKLHCTQAVWVEVETPRLSGLSLPAATLQKPTWSTHTVMSHTTECILKDTWRGWKSECWPTQRHCVGYKVDVMFRSCNVGGKKFFPKFVSNICG